jgi:hypothetical protein
MLYFLCCGIWVPLTTAWHIVRLWVEETPFSYGRWLQTLNKGGLLALGIEILIENYKFYSFYEFYKLRCFLKLNIETSVPIRLF